MRRRMAFWRSSLLFDRKKLGDALFYKGYGLAGEV